MGQRVETEEQQEASVQQEAFYSFLMSTKPKPKNQLFNFYVIAAEEIVFFLINPLTI